MVKLLIGVKAPKFLISSCFEKLTKRNGSFNRVSSKSEEPFFLSKNIIYSALLKAILKRTFIMEDNAYFVIDVWLVFVLSWYFVAWKSVEKRSGTISFKARKKGQISKKNNNKSLYLQLGEKTSRSCVFLFMLTRAYTKSDMCNRESWFMRPNWERLYFVSCLKSWVQTK